jgi:hypothetical protein
MTLTENAKPIVRLVSTEMLSVDDLLQVAAEIDGDVAEVTAYRRQARTLDQDDAPARDRTLGWAKRLREIAAEIKAYATDPETGDAGPGGGYVRFVRHLEGGASKMDEIMVIFCTYGIGFPKKQYGRPGGVFYESDFDDLPDDDTDDD